MTLRVVAVAAPDWAEDPDGSRALRSSDPASLFNACRVAADLAERKIGSWGESSWAASRRDRRDRTLLMHSLAGDLPAFTDLVERERPQLLLIGAMSICLPGAIACAVRAKEMLGDDVCVVLGGRHPSETIYFGPRGVEHHAASPVRLMAEGLVAPVFDLVISGEGEHVIARLGEAVAVQVSSGRSPAAVSEFVHDLKDSQGRWIASWCDRASVTDLVGTAGPLDHNELPSPAEMFGITTSFDVFDDRLTGHVFSDSGNGCVFDCEFCSERRSITGGLAQPDSAAARLTRQLTAVVDVVRTDSPGRRASAFVEDSTLLGGSPAQLTRLTDLLGHAGLDIRFGAQLTVDQVLSRLGMLKELRKVGLDYLFIGVETLEPALVGGMNKDRRSRNGTWRTRTERAIASLADIDVRTGCAVLFGLGESHEQRIALLHLLADWRQRYGSPYPVSLNWATQHPQQKGNGDYRYLDWSVPPGVWSRAFRDFGEATLRYPILGSPPPSLGEVREIADLYAETL